MIVYVDSSALVRSYLLDEKNGAEIRTLLDDPEVTTISGSWTRIEVTGALFRAAKARRADLATVNELLRRDLDPASGSLLLVDVNQADIEGRALEIVRTTGIRSMDAWHLACASIAVSALAEPGEVLAFATHDTDQAAIARELGFTVI